MGAILNGMGFYGLFRVSGSTFLVFSDYMRASLRNIPNLDVMRPGDADETAAAYVSAMERLDGPTALILSRQNLPVIDEPAADKRAGTLKGGYTLIKETSALEKI